MRGEWRSDFLLVAAAHRQVAALASEGQPQQQDEEQRGRHPHPFVAESLHVDVSSCSGRIPPRLRYEQRSQKASLRKGKCAASSASSRPMSDAAPVNKQQKPADQHMGYSMRDRKLRRRVRPAVCQAMEWRRSAAAAVAERPRSTQAAQLTVTRGVEEEPSWSCPMGKTALQSARSNTHTPLAALCGDLSEASHPSAEKTPSIKRFQPQTSQASNMCSISTVWRCERGSNGTYAGDCTATCEQTTVSQHT